MAEISYPFAAASAGGGSEMVSQVEWQNMSHLWGPDRIDFQLTETTYTSDALPLHAEISGSDIVVQPGAAWVGGFYYKNDALLTFSAPTNSGATDRYDLLVLRLDMAIGSANLAIKTGQAATNPVEPTVQRTPGGVWEMPLWRIWVGKNNGGRSLSDRRRYDGPGSTYVPWGAEPISDGGPQGNFVYDMDSNNNGGDSQQEFFSGRDGTFITRHLGKRREYTPDVFTVSNKPSSANRKGYYRYVAPGVVHVSVQINNTSTKAVTPSGDGWIIGITLPIAASVKSRGLFHGFLENPERRDSLPNYMEVPGRTSGSADNRCFLYYTNTKSLTEGLDGLKAIPGKSFLTVTGTYETNIFD
jgi:hypothetical protein